MTETAGPDRVRSTEQIGLSEHYREIFELTRLDEAIAIYDNEESALNGAAK